MSCKYAARICNVESELNGINKGRWWNEGIHSYLYWFVRSFVRSFVCSFVHSFSFYWEVIYLFICPFSLLFFAIICNCCFAVVAMPSFEHLSFLQPFFLLFLFCFVLFCFLSFLMCYLLLMDTTQTELSVCRPSKNLFHLLGSSSLHINSPDSRRHHRSYHVFPSASIGENKSQALAKTQTKI